MGGVADSVRGLMCDDGGGGGGGGWVDGGAEVPGTDTGKWIC